MKETSLEAIFNPFETIMITAKYILFNPIKYIGFYLKTQKILEFLGSLVKYKLNLYKFN